MSDLSWDHGCKDDGPDIESRVRELASLKKRGNKYLIQFYWRGEQRTKTLGAVSPSKAQGCIVQVEAALDVIRRGQHPAACGLLDQGFDIVDVVFPNEKTAHLLKSNGNSQPQQPGHGKLAIPDSLTIGDLVPRYLSYLKVHESDGHWRRVKSRLSHLVAFSGGISVTRLDGELLEAYLVDRRLQHTRDETRKNEVTSIRAMLNWSVENGTLESLPVRKFPVIKTDEADPFLFKSDIDRRIPGPGASAVPQPRGSAEQRVQRARFVRPAEHTRG